MHRRVSSEESRRLVKLVKEVLNLIEVLTASCREEEVLSIAERLKLTFYDATYVYYAKEKKIPLTTKTQV